MELKHQLENWQALGKLISTAKSFTKVSVKLCVLMQLNHLSLMGTAELWDLLRLSYLRMTCEGQPARSSYFAHYMETYIVRATYDNSSICRCKNSA